MTHLPSFPASRPRRLRQAAWIREIVRDVRLHPSDFIWPVFVVEGARTEAPIASLPGVHRMSIDVLIERAREAHANGIQAIALFPVVDGDKKTEMGDEALNPDNLVCRTVKTLKGAIPTLGIITDIALDPYTSHGQDGIMQEGRIVNDVTMDLLAQQAVLHAESGADIVAPSDMMDGRIGAIREALENTRFQDTLILSYAAKYASSMYGPFRDAVDSAQYLAGADKFTYQMDPARKNEWLQEIAMDIEEGADMVMVKPGLPYLDIVSQASQQFSVPVLSYHVSGEYAGVMFAAQAGAIDAKAVLLEQMTCFKRAGANAIFTYAAPELVKWL